MARFYVFFFFLYQKSPFITIHLHSISFPRLPCTLQVHSPCLHMDSSWLIHCQRQLNADSTRIANVYDSNHQAVINSCCTATMISSGGYHKLSSLSRFSHWTLHFFCFIFFLQQYSQNCRRWTFQSKVHSKHTHTHVHPNT